MKIDWRKGDIDFEKQDYRDLIIIIIAAVVSSVTSALLSLERNRLFGSDLIGLIKSAGFIVFIILLILLICFFAFTFGFKAGTFLWRLFWKLLELVGRIFGKLLKWLWRKTDIYMKIYLLFVPSLVFLWYWVIHELAHIISCFGDWKWDFWGREMNCSIISPLTGLAPYIMDMIALGFIVFLFIKIRLLKKRIFIITAATIIVLNTILNFTVPSLIGYPISDFYLLANISFFWFYVGMALFLINGIIWAFLIKTFIFSSEFKRSKKIIKKNKKIKKIKPFSSKPET